MHDCRKFREELTDFVLDERVREQLDGCRACRQYFDEAVTLVSLMDDLSAAIPELPKTYWSDFTGRLQQRLTVESRLRGQRRSVTGMALASAAVIALTVSGLVFRATEPLAGNQDSLAGLVQSASGVRIVDNHIQGLDSEVVDFLGESELFLRNFTKIEPTNTADIEDARSRAGRQLSGIDVRKEAATDFLPVQIVLKEYESVLKDIEKLDSSEAVAADIADIQGRIQRDGLIASMKVYQPRVQLIIQH